MIIYDENLYISDSAEKNRDKIIKRVTERKLTAALSWCVTLPTNDANLFDIYNMGELLFTHYRGPQKDLHVVGIAKSKDDAINLTSQIIEECWAVRKDLNVKQFFEDIKS